MLTCGLKYLLKDSLRNISIQRKSIIWMPYNPYRVVFKLSCESECIPSHYSCMEKQDIC